MKAGKLDRRVLIQRPVPVRDATGDVLQGWVDVATVWAEFERVSGGEDFSAEQRSNKQMVTFTIRYRPGIDPQMRVVYDGEVFEIEDVGEPKNAGRGSARRESLVLSAFAREVASGG